MLCQSCFSYPAQSRALCSRCLGQFRRHDPEALDELFPRFTRDRHDVIQEIVHLGFDRRIPHRPQFRRMAPRLGMNATAVERAWLRHTRPRRVA